ncbi:MAG: peptide/nickel transport system substrate-binding protein [Thermomicrobiales bacterium]|nr:peptide/nickel transport system substrate-binding protein [Thermomicrobiales bacterium]
MIGQLQVIRDSRPVYDQQPVESDELRLLLAAGDNGDFSPVAFRQDFQVMASYLDPLVRIDEVTMEPRPWLAESWEITDEGKTITYTLRDDVTWHDGSRLHARDVVFSLFLYRDDIDSAVRNFFTNMDFAEAVNRRTVKVTLTSPDANWLLNASSQLVFQREQYTDAWASRPEGERTLTGFNWKKDKPVGTGPWKVDKWSGDGVTLKRNDDYWAGPPHFKTLSLGVEAEPDQRVAAWREGHADLLWPVTFTSVQSASDTPGRLYVADAASVMFAAFNFDNPARDPNTLLSDIRIRRALSLAIDRDRYAAEVFGGFIRADRAGTVAQPWAHDETIANPPRDVAAAEALLREAGWGAPADGSPVGDGSGNKLELSVIVRNDSRPELLAVLQSIVTDLAQVGVGLRVRALSPERFFDVSTSEREYDLIAYSYNLFPGFTDFDLYGSNWDIRQNPQGWNPGGYSNAYVDKAIRDYLGAETDDAALDALRRLQHAVNDDLFGLWFGFPQELILAREDILGFQPNISWETWHTRLLWRQPAAT